MLNWHCFQPITGERELSEHQPGDSDASEEAGKTAFISERSERERVCREISRLPAQQLPQPAALLAAPLPQQGQGQHLPWECELTAIGQSRTFHYGGWVEELTSVCLLLFYRVHVFPSPTGRRLYRYCWVMQIPEEAHGVLFPPTLMKLTGTWTEISWSCDSRDCVWCFELLKGLASHQNWITLCNFTRFSCITEFVFVWLEIWACVSWMLICLCLIVWLCIGCSDIMAVRWMCAWEY